MILIYGVKRFRTELLRARKLLPHRQKERDRDFYKSWDYSPFTKELFLLTKTTRIIFIRNAITPVGQ